MTNQTLKPCPFCGEDDILSMFDDDLVVWQIDCGNCGAMLRAATEDLLFKEWNTRHESEAVRELEEAHRLGIAIGILKNSKKFCINDEMREDYASRIKHFDEEYKKILAKHGKGTV